MNRAEILKMKVGALRAVAELALREAGRTGAKVQLAATPSEAKDNASFTLQEVTAGKPQKKATKLTTSLLESALSQLSEKSKALVSMDGNVITLGKSKTSKEAPTEQPAEKEAKKK